MSCSLLLRQLLLLTELITSKWLATVVWVGLTSVSLALAMSEAQAWLPGVLAKWVVWAYIGGKTARARCGTGRPT